MTTQRAAQASDAKTIDAARRAYEAYRWTDVFDALAGLEERLPAEDLDRLADAAWWAGRLETCIAVRERAYEAHTRAGDRRQAARAALHLWNDYSHRLKSSIATAWVRRAEKLLVDQPESDVHAYLERARLNQFLSQGKLDEALEHAESVLAIGTRLGNLDVEALGLQDKGRVLIAMGRVDEGLALLDEAMVAAVGGELSPLPTAIVYCNATVVTQDLTDYRRASEFSEAAARWCERQAISGFPGMCRVRRAEVIRLRGAWAQAEEEAVRACAELKEFSLDYAGEGFYQVGEVRLRMGDLDAADVAFRQAHELGRDPVPGLAQLRLAQGDPKAGAMILRRALHDPATTKLFRARILPASVEIALDEGDRQAAELDVSELEGLVEVFATHALRASAAEARGRLALAQERPAEACQSLTRAWRLWQETDAPYEAARAREMLGHAYLVAGDTAQARLEVEAAHATFVRLGAVRDAARSSATLRTVDNASGLREPAEVRTFMFTDIVRSTDLIDVIGDDAWLSLLAWHDRTVRALIRERRGEEIHHAGDGFFVAFPAAGDAIECALAIRRTMVEHRRSSGFAPQVRIGLHTADATWQGGSYEGRAVHVAARIGGLAGSDEILATREVFDAAGDRYAHTPLRVERVRGIRDPVEVAALDIGTG